MNELYSYRRTIMTLSGSVDLKVHARRCPDHRKTNRNAIHSVLKDSGFDPGITMAVGILRWIMDYQRSEIQILLESRGIRISTGEISFLSREFLLRFYCIHRRHMKDLGLIVYILHLDGTGESGGEIVFMAKDGLTNITMDAVIMPSESSEYVTPFLEGIKDVFGIPVAILRDMGIAIKGSATAVFPGILQLICHYHFTKALGKDVFSSYQELRDSMVSTEALALISRMTLPEKNGNDGILYAEKIWIAVAAEYILYPRTIPSKFPFVLPYLQVLERCIEIRNMMKSIIGWNASHMKVVKPVMAFHSAVKEISMDPAVMERYRILSRVWSWFESIRKSLRVSREMNSGESAREPADIAAIGNDLNASLRSITKEGEFAGGELERISRTIKNRIEDHRDELLSPVTVDGKTINVKRHNGIEEIGHRWSRMHIRRRTGRSQTAKEMGMYGALTAILSNIENKNYIEKVLSRIDFLNEFVSITPEEMDNARKLIRPNPCEPIVRKDRERKPVLDALVKILETHEDLPTKEVKAWIKSIKI